MINIIEQPTTDHIPTTDCLRWEFQPDVADVFATVGSSATLVVVFPASMSTPGTPGFKIWGYDFEARGAGTPQWGASFFVVQALGTKSAQNFAAMLQSNLFFASATSVVLNNLTVTVTWNGCGPQPNFGGTAMVFTNLNGVGVTTTVTNGVAPELVEGYKMTLQLLAQHDDDSYLPVSPVTAYAPTLTCEDVNPLIVDFMPQAKRYIYTPMPDLTATSFTPTGNNTARAFAVRYGSVWREDCQPVAGDTYDTEPAIVLNAAFQLHDLATVRRYSAATVAGFPPGQGVARALTLQPRTAKISMDSYVWLSAIMDAVDPFQTYSSVGVQFIVTYKTGSPTTHNYTRAIGLQRWQVEQFNVSPAYLETLGVNLNNVLYYDVIGRYYDGGLAVGNGFEQFRFILSNDCFGTTDLYFANSLGGITTVLVEKDAADMEQGFTEILTEVACETSRETKAKYKGRGMADLINTERFTFSAVEGDTPEQRANWADLKASPQRWLRVNSNDMIDAVTPKWVARKLLIDAGGIRVFENAGKLILTVTGSWGYETVPGNEPPI
jgi:hypothetical protein